MSKGSDDSVLNLPKRSAKNILNERRSVFEDTPSLHLGPTRVHEDVVHTHVAMQDLSIPVDGAVNYVT